LIDAHDEMATADAMTVVIGHIRQFIGSLPD
jgi:hypothetical protein